ncbi:XdhC family protein [Catenulispora sp. NF23]|uniref:XdhC family protein n=1 Tax=Catenulispora pinistramenti TaxID=2705254 RepID=UPI001BAAFFF4|nr:XdhC/CoxI family protein [Catenulispora pinistramenti]MBS2536040.1 XdhC family protein [Catenulispora pinistramenti]
MRDITEDLHAWHAAGKPYAIASVVAVKGSAPRELGAALAVDAEGTAVGSVSGGCVEGAVYELCVESLQHGRPVLETFGYSDDDAFAVGLTCGGELEVFIQPVFPDREPAIGSELEAMSAGEPTTRPESPAADGRGSALTARPESAVGAALSATVAGEPIALARVIAGPADLVGRSLAVRPQAPEILWGPPGASIAVDGDPWSATGAVSPGLDRVIARHARAMVESGATGTIAVGTEGEGQDCGEPVTVFIQSFVTAPRMLIFGAIDFAAALVRVGKYLGYHVTVCDARPVFATRRRFPEADDVVVAWPHRYVQTTRVDARTVVAVLTHDAKFDVPLLVQALRLPIAYVGAMGSRRTCAQRADRLREAGLSDAEIANLHAPIGLDLGARTSEETALSIAAEIVAARHGGTGRALADVSTAIHHAPAVPPLESGVPA